MVLALRSMAEMQHQRHQVWMCPGKTLHLNKLPCSQLLGSAPADVLQEQRLTPLLPGSEVAAFSPC